MSKIEEEKIRAVIRQWEKSIQDGDMTGILASHTEDILMFDVPEPIQSTGLQEYQKTWELFFRYGAPGSDVFIIEDLRIAAGSDVAFASGLLRIGGSQVPKCRLTIGLKKLQGNWLIAHEHHSAPHNIDT